MESKKKKQLIANAILFVVILVVTIWFVFRDENVEEVVFAMKQMSVGHLLLAVCVAFVYVAAEGFMMWYLLRCMSGASSLKSCISCAFIGFLFSGITPSATGGQPMQLYYLKKDGNSWSFGSLALMILALMYKLVLVLFGVGIWLFWGTSLKSYLGIGYYRLFLLGLFLNSALVAGLLMVMLTPSVVRLLIDKAEWLAVKLHIMKKAGSKSARLDHFMGNYQGALRYLKQHKERMVVILLATVLQRVLVFALTYIVYRGMGLQGTACTTIMWLQASVYIAVDMLPIPGAQGITEAMYRHVFLTIFGVGSVTASMCISRGVSFYLMLLVGICVAFYQFVIKKMG